MGVCRVVLTVAAFAVAAWGGASGGTGANSLLAGGLQLTASAAAAPVREPEKVGFQAFHDRLAPYGQWMNDPRWGAVWRPDIRRGFWPYRQGHWDMTTGYGTVWVSDYPWGDIPFHFGRWFDDPGRGWLWVPGYVWGPAWVIWRAGDGKIGWMPMPPWIDYDGAGEFPDDWSDRYGYANYGYSPIRFYSLWCFVDAADLYAPGVDYYVIGPGTNARFIDRTVGWTRYSLTRGHVFNQSIDPVRFRTAFGFRLRAQERNDSEHRLGPIIDYGMGLQIEARELGMIGHRPHAATAALLPVATRPVSPGLPEPTKHAEQGAHGRTISIAVHPPATKSRKTPRVYTHTEVIPDYPGPPSQPAAVPQNMAAPGKTPHAWPQPKRSFGHRPG